MLGRTRNQQPSRQKNKRRKLSLESLHKRELMAGDLDFSFGTGFGVVATDLGGIEGIVSSAVQDDGRIVSVGTTDFGGGGYNLAVVRYLSDGTIDNSFGGLGVPDGMVVMDLNQQSDQARDVAILDDGKILVLGETNTGTEDDVNYDAVLLRFNTDGTLDETFGDSGVLIVPTVSPGNGIVQQMVVAGDRILIVLQDGLTRLHMNGTIDTGFHGDGHFSAISDLDPEAYTHFSAAAFGNGKYVIGGWDADSGSMIARLNFDGSLDPSFGDGGVALPPGLGTLVDDIHVRSDDSIVGLTSGGLQDVFRLNANGTLDNTFHVNGMYEINGGQTTRFKKLILQPTGAIVAVGKVDDDMGAMRLGENGQLDLTYGVNGYAKFGFSGDLSTATSAIGYANGKVLLTGMVLWEEGDVVAKDFLLFRLTGDDATPQFDGPSGVKTAAPSVNPSSRHELELLTGAGLIDEAITELFTGELSRPANAGQRLAIGMKLQLNPESVIDLTRREREERDRSKPLGWDKVGFGMIS